MILGYGELSFAEIFFHLRRGNIRDRKSVFHFDVAQCRHLCKLSSFTHVQGMRDLRGKAGVVQQQG